MHPLRPSGDPATDVVALRSWLDDAHPARLQITTSGSTATPKRVLLSRDAVLASVHASAERVGTGTWVLALPSTYVAGLQVICRSLVAGRAPVVAEDHASLAEAVAAAGDEACVSLVSTQLHRAMDDPDAVAALAGCRLVLLGGGPVDAGLRARAQDAGIPLVATYGASETAGGCVYDGYPLDGVAVVVGAEGRIRIGGPTVFDGYDGDEVLTAATLVDGWYLTDDAGRLDEDGRLQVLGRLDDVVVSGGVKVPLPAVGAALRSHPALAAAEAVAVEDPEWGSRVVAVVVPHAGAPALEELRDLVGERHPRAWAPRDVLVLDRMPLLGTGKVDRRALRDAAEAARSDAEAAGD